MKTKLDWFKVWDDFNRWYTDAVRDNREKHTCKKCGYTHIIDPEWGEQQDAIQRIVERHIQRSK